MTKNIGRKPKTAPATPFPEAPNKLHISKATGSGFLCAMNGGSCRASRRKSFVSASFVICATITTTRSARWIRNVGPCMGTRARAPIS